MIVIDAPTAPDVWLKVVMLGAGAVTVKPTPLLGCPPTVTTTFPVVAALGTSTTMLVALQLVGVAVVPLKVTVLVPGVVPKFAPEIVTDDPTAPEVGLRLIIAGAVVAVPERDIDMGTTFVLLAILRVPLRAPAAVGEKVTLAVQLLPGLRGDEATHPSVSEKSPVVLSATIPTDPLELLVKVTACAALVVPVGWPENVREPGDTATYWGNTCAWSVSWTLLPPCVYTILTAALPAPTAVTCPVVSAVTTAVFVEV